jgi:hypothetical protein
MQKIAKNKKAGKNDKAPLKQTYVTTVHSCRGRFGVFELL